MKYYLVKNMENADDVKECIFHAPNVRAIQEFFKRNNKIFYVVDLIKSHMSEEQVSESGLDVYELVSGDCSFHEFRKANQQYYENDIKK